MIRALLVALLLVACTPAATHDVTGTFSVGVTEDAIHGTPCSGEGGYDDIGEGTQVSVTNQDGTLIGTGSLGAGTRTNRACTFPLTISGLPDATFYSFEVSRRGKVTYSMADMEAAGWTVALSVGVE